MQIPLYELLTIKYPDINIGIFPGCTKLVDHGNGPIIDEWNYSSAGQPSSDDLLVWASDQNIQAAYQVKLNKLSNENILQQLEIIDFKTIRSLRENDTNMINQFISQAASLRSQLLPMTVEGVLTATQNKTPGGIS